MSKYTELKEKQSKNFSLFPIAWAFNNKQLEEAKIKLGVTDNSELCQTYGGWLIKKTDAKKLHDLIAEQEKEMEELLKNPQYLMEAFRYELANHEYCITYDYEPTLDAFGMKYDELTPEQLAALKQARKEYLASVEY